MARMGWTFLNVYTKVAEFLGLGSSPTGANLTKVKDLVYRGYMNFLIPIHPKSGEVYTWSFLKKDAFLTLQSGEYVYMLPPDFFDITEPFIYTDDNNRVKITKKSPQIIKEHRATSVTMGDPYEYAIRSAKYDKSFGYQPKEVLFYPTPDSAYVLTYSYIYIPVKPENDGDYFIGDALTSDVILECCLAVAEQQEDEVRGLHTSNAEKLLAQLILADEPSAPDSVGNVVDSGLYRESFGFLRRRDTGSITTVYEIDGVNEG